MINRINQLFSQQFETGPNAEQQQKAIQTATAALLIEVSKADYELSDEEREQVITTLTSKFELEPAMLDELMELAHEQLDINHSLYPFTRLVNDHYSYEQKLALIQGMWEVAYADGNLHVYEEHLIRKVAELIYLKHQDFVRLKLTTAAALQSSD